MRYDDMTDKQSNKADIQARLDELNRLEAVITDPKILKVIAERKQVLRTALDSILST